MSNVFDSLLGWRVIDAISRTGSLKGASIELGISLSNASKLVKSMENYLGVELLDRSKKPALLSVFALNQLHLVRDLISIDQALEQSVTHFKTQAKIRKIRYGLPTCCIASHVIRFLEDYRKIRPLIDIEIFSSVGIEEIRNGLVDIAFFMYEPQREPDLNYLPCGICANMMVASRDYLNKFGIPQKVEDLSEHKLLLTRKDGVVDPEVIYSGSEAFDLNTFKHTKVDSEGNTKTLYSPREPIGANPNIQYGNDYSSYISALEGQGIAIDLPLSFVGDRLLGKELVPVLPRWHRKRWRKFMVYKKESAGYEEVDHFARWYQAVETEDSQMRWKYFYNYFKVSLDTIGILD